MKLSLKRLLPLKEMSLKCLHKVGVLELNQPKTLSQVSQEKIFRKYALSMFLLPTSYKM